MESKSSYRLVSSEGVFEYLQYKKTVITKILGVKFHKITWEYIPYIENRETLVFDFRKYICEHNTNLKSFVEKYPDVTVYLNYCYNKWRQDDEAAKRRYEETDWSEIDAQIKKRQEEAEAKKKIITYL